LAVDFAANIGRTAVFPYIDEILLNKFGVLRKSGFEKVSGLFISQNSSSNK